MRGAPGSVLRDRLIAGRSYGRLPSYQGTGDSVSSAPHSLRILNCRAIRRWAWEVGLRKLRRSLLKSGFGSLMGQTRPSRGKPWRRAIIYILLGGLFVLLVVMSAVASGI